MLMMELAPRTCQDQSIIESGMHFTVNSEHKRTELGEIDTLYQSVLGLVVKSEAVDIVGFQV